MKIIAVIFLISLSVSGNLAQNAYEDSLNTALSKSTNPAERFDLIVKILEDANAVRAASVDSAKCFQLLQIARRLKNDSLLAISYNWVGFYYKSTTGDNTLTLEYYLKALPLAERVKDKRRISSLYFDVALEYFNLQDYEAAYKYNAKGFENLPDRSSAKYNFMLVQYQRNMVAYFLLTSQPDSALYYAQAMLASSRMAKDNISEFLALFLNAHAYAQIGANKTAEIYFQKAKAISNNIESLDAKFQYYNYYIDFLLNNKRIPEALEQSNELWRLIQQTSNNNMKISGAAIKRKVFDALHQIDSVYLYWSLQMEYSQAALSKIKAVALSERLRGVEEKNREAAYQNRLKILALLSGLVIILIIAFFLYRNNRNKQKAYTALQEQKEEIQNQKMIAESTLVILKTTQDRLVEKEKIAAEAAARLQELDAVKTRLYTNITHEFRTPLTVILGMTENIADGAKDPDHKNQLSAIKRNGQQLLHLVNQMLDLNKLESGALALRYRQGDVVNYIKYITESFHSLAQNKNLVVEFHAEAKSLMMDYEAVRLQQVVSNLLTNAIKFTPENGKIDVSLEVKNLEGFGNSPGLVLKIKDTGIGVAASDLPHIFDRFYQADTSSTRSGEGTGIGLALAQELVKLMGGAITVSSVLGEGTEFTVALPVKNNEALAASEEISAQGFATSEEEPTDSPPAGHPAPLNRPTILIADDNDDVRAYIASCLSGDYQLFMAKNGQECEDMAFTYTPDLIISDVMMPVKDGVEACKTLKTDERTSHIPIIMLTAKADMESKLEGLERGADVYLVKPFHKEELLLRIKKLLELRKQLQKYYLTAVSNQLSAVSYQPSAEDKKAEGSKPIADGLQNAFVIKVKTAIESHLDDSEFSIEKLSRAVHLSESQMQRKLGALTGLSANDFIRHIRLTKAKDLILNSPYSLSAIAIDCGFNDPSYFGRIFKKEFGLTPHAWREQNA